MFAKFECRRMDLQAARKLLGASIGICPKPAIFKGYIDLELRLREFDRIRILYQKYIEFDPAKVEPWINAAELEGALGEIERARAIYELAISQNGPHSAQMTLWRSYISFENSRMRVRLLYERLLAVNGCSEVWISYALSEVGPLQVVDGDHDTGDDEQMDVDLGDSLQARKILQRGWLHMRSLTSSPLSRGKVYVLLRQAHIPSNNC
jgi:crooked neck